MPSPKRAIRGLQNIRTGSGTSDQVSEPYKAFLRIGALEMEKSRRGKEKECAVIRVQNIDARFREIEAEKTELLEGLGTIKRSNARPGNTTERPSPSPPAHDKGGFKISY
jgi:hypothetical protein